MPNSSRKVNSPLNFIIRRGVAADAHLLAELGARTFSETFAADNTQKNMTVYLRSSFSAEKQAEELADSLSLFLIAEADGVALGYAMLRWGEAEKDVTGNNPIEIVRLYVSQDSVGTGLGAALMEACIREARIGGHETLWLGVWEHNTRARAFYRKWGFHEVGTHVFQLGNDPQTDLLMQRSIT